MNTTSQYRANVIGNGTTQSLPRFGLVGKDNIFRVTVDGDLERVSRVLIPGFDDLLQAFHVLFGFNNAPDTRSEHLLSNKAVFLVSDLQSGQLLLLVGQHHEFDDLVIATCRGLDLSKRKHSLRNVIHLFGVQMAAHQLVNE